MSAVLLINKWLWSLLFCSNLAHPYHVSATEMEYDAVQKRVEISSKIFTDDFEEVLFKLYKQKTDLSDASIRPQMTALITKYIQSHLSLGSDGKVIPLQLYGWEIDHEAVYVYTVANTSHFNTKNIAVANTILYDLYTDQENIVHFIVNGKRKSTKVTCPEKYMSFSF
ncbi:MAG: hypothetical protein QM640_00465 [Niabella sp.]